jgi:4-hydroxy-tetrahydrodipicolinate synthase
VILYNNPSTCAGLKIDVDTVARLAEIPNILGVKDSSGDLQNTIEFIRVVPERFAVMMGRDTLIYSSLIFGARGSVPATANFAAKIVVDIYEAFRRGDHAAAKAAQLRLNPLRLALGLGTAPGGVKAALSLMGQSIGPSRSPVAPLSPDKQQKMSAVLDQAGLLARK